MAKKRSDQPANELQTTNNFTMAVACRLTGIESHRIRRWEAGGLLTPLRSQGHQRLFSETDIKLIIQIANLEDEGINAEGIKAILEIRRGKRE